MKKIFIYFSLTGNGDFLANRLKPEGFEIRKVVEKKKVPKKFFFQVLSGGFRAGLNLKGKLIDYNNNIEEFDEVVIGSPVWNGRFPPAINSVLDQTDFAGKKLTFLFYSGSGDIPKVNKKIQKLYPEAKVMVLKEPKHHGEELEKLNTL